MRIHKIAAVVTAAVVVLLGALLARDVQRIDTTSGGYSHPYTDFTGEPIDWSTHELTDEGFRDNAGWILNTSLNCTTGQLRGHVGPLSFDYRTLSERAIVVHEPHIACNEAGFEPTWDHPDPEGVAPSAGTSHG